MRCNGGITYCEKTSWNFESNDLEGWAPVEGDDSGEDQGLAVSTVSAHTGTHALSAHVNFAGTRSRFRLGYIPCGHGDLDLRGRTLTFWVFLSPSGAAPATGHVCYPFARTASTCFGCDGTGSPVTTTGYTALTLALGNDPNAADVSSLGLDCFANVASPWAGTVYVDDISVQ